MEITDHFTCISVNVIYCITCTLCKKIYRGETRRRLAGRFANTYTDASKPVARHFNLPYYFHHNMTICGLSLHHGNTESHKNLEQKFIFQLGTLYPHRINERLSSTNLFTNSCHHISTNRKAPPHSHRNQLHPTIPLFALTKGQRSKRLFSKSFMVVIQPLSTRVIKSNFC